MKSKWILSGAALVILAGCSQTRSGVVATPREESVGYHVADIPVALSDGRQTLLNRIRLDVTIVAFTAFSGGSAGGEADPVLADLAGSVDFFDLPVDVVQVVLPSGRPGEAALPGTRSVLVQPYASGASANRVTILIDRDGIASRAYPDSKAGDVFLIDWNNQVVAKGTIENLGNVPQRARELGWTASQWHAGS